MISVTLNAIAFFLLAVALYLAYHAGAFQREFKDNEKRPPVIVFAIIVALSGYLLMVFA
ncbi:hypothetical protein [Ruegeria arenilitoris]|uniref:hypothetical protein n=1 Tax=Ruegeria arenilitoris TaxID=1173585 RepID=UPI001480974E|nr:hypothetical protein [Ruegeria arenilitoris]